MILVADAGSTKTSWALISGNDVHYAQTKGIHALMHSDESIKNVLTDVSNFLAENESLSYVKMIYFFGAGVQNNHASDRLSKLFNPFFSTAEFHFRSDMEAACLATAAQNDAWVFILGTGSNSCVWKDKKIQIQVPSGGYILGDEGSGSHLGKKLLKAWMRKKLPDDLQLLVNNTFQITYHQLVNNLYMNDAPNAYLASFVPFIHQNRLHEYIQQLIIKTFTELKQAHEDYIITTGGAVPNRVCFVGSVAYYFRNELKKVFEPQYSLNCIVHRPIEGLVEYFKHQITNL